jgi:hypothetical protein
MNARPHNLKRLWLPSVLCCLATVVHAETVEGTLIRGNVAYIPGGTVRLDPASTTQLRLNNSVLAVLNATHVQLAPIAPGTANITRNTRNKYTSIAVDAPISSITMAFNGNVDELEVKSFVSRGGLLLTAVPDEITNTGGSLTITSLNVNLDEHRIYADLEGANGIGLKEQVPMWRFDAFTPLGQVGHTTCSLALIGCNTTVSIQTTLSGLRFEAESFGYFSTALGLTEDGISALHHVTDFGTITTSVPEPSTVAQMGLGLAALGLLAKRRRRTTH